VNRWQVGDEVRIARIDFTGRVDRIVPTRDPVIVLRATSGAELTMRASTLNREANAS
jgi:hypothetical protein